MNLPNYLILDLNDNSVRKHEISSAVFEKHLGGKILGVKILTDITKSNINPLAQDAVFIVNTGPMNGTGAPSSSRFNITFKNVLTNGIASSNCGGQFGVMLKRAGIDGLIVKGKADEPVVIEILDGEINVKPAQELWGLDTETVQAKLPKNYGKLVIGVAGENLVRYACAVSGERVAGRCGAGAVMGSKNIKAFIAYGTQKAYVAEPDGFLKNTKKWVKFLKSHPMTGETLPAYGSAGLVNKANSSNVLPTHNFSKGNFKDADNLSGETLAKTLLTRNSGCISCPIRCERRVMVNGKEVKGPEFETLGLFGSNLDNGSLELINQINYYADLLGMDTISLAGSIAFAMELQEKGMAEFGVKFGETENLLAVINKIANREGIYYDIGEGSKIMSEKYGGKDFSMHSKGLELAAYEPRRSVGMGLGYATSNRGGCHLNGGYLALMESVGAINMNSQTNKGKPELVIMFQNAMEAVSAAGFCFFTMQTFVPAVLFKTNRSSMANRFAGSAMLASRGVLGVMWNFTPWIMPIKSMFLFPHCRSIELATGLKMSTGKFLELGERGYNIERLFNLREGLTMADDSLPERVTATLQDDTKANTSVCLEPMLKRYYKIRGWDEFGVPKAKKLEKLGIDTSYSSKGI